MLFQSSEIFKLIFKMMNLLFLFVIFNFNDLLKVITNKAFKKTMRADIIINSLTQLRLHFPFNEEKIVVNRKENAMSYSLPSVLFTF